MPVANQGCRVSLATMVALVSEENRVNAARSVQSEPKVDQANEG